MKQFKDLLKVNALIFILGFSIVLLNPDIAYGLMYLVLTLTGIGMFQSYYLGLKRKPKDTKTNTVVKLKIDTNLTPFRILTILVVGGITLLFSMALMHETLVFQRVYMSLIGSAIMMLLTLYAYNKTNGITVLKKRYRKEYFKFTKGDLIFPVVYGIYCIGGAIFNPKEAFSIIYIMLFFIAVMVLTTIGYNIRRYKRKEMKDISKTINKYKKEYFKFTKFQIGYILAYALFVFWATFNTKGNAFLVMGSGLIFVALMVLVIIQSNIKKYKKIVANARYGLYTRHETNKEMKEVKKLLTIKENIKLENLAQMQVTQSHIEANEIPKEHTKVKSKSLLLCMLGLTFAFIGGMAISFLYPTKSILENVAQMLVIVVPSIGGMAYGYGLATMETFGKYVLSIKPNEQVTDETKN